MIECWVYSDYSGIFEGMDTLTKSESEELINEFSKNENLEKWEDGFFRVKRNCCVRFGDVAFNLRANDGIAFSEEGSDLDNRILDFAGYSGLFRDVNFFKLFF